VQGSRQVISRAGKTVRIVSGARLEAFQQLLELVDPRRQLKHPKTTRLYAGRSDQVPLR
jgi:hypothetical protein